MNSNLCTKIEFDPVKNRKLVASSFIKRGQIVVCEEPYSFVINDPYLEVTCYNCGFVCSGATVYSCGGNDRARYCSEFCIRKDYPLHQYERPGNSKFTEYHIEGESNSCRLIFRISCIRRSENSAMNHSQSILSRLCNYLR